MLIMNNQLSFTELSYVVTQHPKYVTLFFFGFVVVMVHWLVEFW